MKYAIQVNRGPEPSPGSATAREFIRALRATGHEVVQVFFYQDGIENAFSGSSDRSPGRTDWSSLASLGVDLVYCQTAAERRGRSMAATASGFRPGGLGAWVDICLRADRVLVFG